jgi:hypothetical protein
LQNEEDETIIVLRRGKLFNPITNREGS